MNLLYTILILSFTVPVKSDIQYKKLTWNDFKIKQVTDNTASESVTEIGYNYDSELGVTVSCSFDRNESFVTPTAKTNYILNHEQKHFDITFIYARKLASLLSKQTNLSEQKVDEIYNQMLTEKDLMQQQYDSETNHSENKSAQVKWDGIIYNLLK